MNLLRLVWSYLKAKPLNTFLNAFLLSLGISVIVVILVFSHQLQEKISTNTKGIDLVVGAKGSPLQLILCNIFHIDFPTGNIKLSDAESLAKHRLIKKAIPLALGDSFQGYRLVGTTHEYVYLFNLPLQQGEWWADDFQVTIGAVVAENLKLKVGDRFVSTHGLAQDGHDHEEKFFVVKGIIKKSYTAIDNLILTTIPSIWEIHEEHGEEDHAEVHTPIQKDSSLLIPGGIEKDSTREITSLLVQFRNPLAAIQLPRYINGQTNMQAASPAFEAARLFSILGVGISALNAFAYVLIFISGLSIFIALYNSLKERKYDLAIMRSMGASRRKLFLTVITEGTTLTAVGSLAGLALGHFIFWAFTNWTDAGLRGGMTSAVFYAEEYFIFAGSLLLGIICSLLPAMQAYRTDIHKVLAGN